MPEELICIVLKKLSPKTSYMPGVCILSKLFENKWHLPNLKIINNAALFSSSLEDEYYI
jgi:hypothetical protein